MAKKRQKYPPDMALVRFGLAKQLYERIRTRKDRIVDRTTSGKPIYGYRPEIELSQDKPLEPQLAMMEDTAHAIYRQAKDTVVYIVSADNQRHIAEAWIDGISVWNAEHRDIEGLVQMVFQTFPKGKKAEIKPPETPESMEITDLQKLIDLKKMEAKKREIESYGERMDFSELPETTSEQRDQEMREGRPDRNRLYDPKTKFNETQTNVLEVGV